MTISMKLCAFLTLLSAHKNDIDWNEDKLYKEPNEAHDGESFDGRKGGLLEL